MTEDQNQLASDLDQLAADHFRLATNAANLANRVRRLGRVGDALDDLRNGACLTVRQAAMVAMLAIRRSMTGSQMPGGGGARSPRSRVLSRDALFAYVEKWRGGPSARDAAAARLQEYWPKWQSQEMPIHVKRATG